MYQPMIPGTNIPQHDPPRPPHETLPTMYDLPSEDPQEPGLPDEFHEFQPQLLRETFQSPQYPADRVFIGTDINLYYDLKHPLWYKRPDWFVVLDVSPAEQQSDLRLSYVRWQESESPFLMVELLSPGTEAEDLGQKVRALTEREAPPGKWEVYERMLRVPFYAVFDRYTLELRMFQLVGGRYLAVDLAVPRFWFEEIELGLGVWQGRYAGIDGQWLRWYDAADWIPTLAERAEREGLQAEAERQRAEQNRQRAEQANQRAERERQRAEQESQRAEQERQRADRLAERLRELGLNPDQL
ncbi:MAG: Uma2 family endonuclease [Oculatellaceae cyanobacterium Prado106]|jgi:Uma2 family endonuclease|nr:Uma2 family endonuclease [Oculatellaceae cyanobacterium Prado106]